MGLEGEKKCTNVEISKEEITPSTFVPKRCLWKIAFDYSNSHIKYKLTKKKPRNLVISGL